MDINPNYSGFTQVYSFITDRTELLCICFYIDGKIQCSLRNIEAYTFSE